MRGHTIAIQNRFVVAEEVAERLLLLAAEGDDPATFLDEALPALMAAAESDAVVLARGERGRWRELCRVGLDRTLAWELLGEALDSQRTGVQGGWHAVPLPGQEQPNEVVAVHHSQTATRPPAVEISRLTAWLGAGLRTVRNRHRQRQQIGRLQTVLAITRQWGQTQQMDTLLQQIAEAATRLLGAERASIFLWDKRNHLLVGRPALGVEEGELRIADDVGVVGHVLRSGELRRVDRQEAGGEIDHRVDRQLKFRTRNLLCAPLQTSRGDRFGAFEVLNKLQGDFTPDDELALAELAGHAAVALENTRQVEQLLTTRNQLAEQAASHVQLLGECAAIEGLRSTIERLAETDLAILILGENGTGKEVVAQRLHYLSARRHEPFVAVNCAALTETLLESELFGHEKGAFTDAHEARPGKFELASGGTLFLDEIGDLSPGGQAKLLRVLEEKVVVRVGGSRQLATDTRVIAATNQNLAKMVRERRFREDLFFRLSVVTLELPPLRKRNEDILLLGEHFLHQFCVKARRRPPRFTPAARRRLLGHPWPGNIRELRNLMERLAYLFQGDEVDAADLAFSMPTESPGVGLSLELPLTEATRRFQIQYIEQQIQAAGDNMTDAAARLGLHRSNLYRKMHQLGMVAEENSAALADRPRPRIPPS